MTVKRTLQQQVSLLVSLSELGFDGHGRKVDPETSNLGGGQDLRNAIGPDIL
jgi:hypothetical protein